jgi:hypothetical protein
VHVASEVSDLECRRRVTRPNLEKSRCVEPNHDGPVVLEQQHRTILEPIGAAQHHRTVRAAIGEGPKSAPRRVLLSQRDVLDCPVVRNVVQSVRERRLGCVAQDLRQLQHGSRLQLDDLSVTLARMCSRAVSGP